MQLTICSIAWDADDWTYAGEGAHHAVFHYVGESSDFVGFLVSFDKHDLAQSKWLTETTDDKDACPVLAKQDDQDTLSFIREIVAFSVALQYLDIPRPVSVPWSLLRDLCDKTLQQDVIPPRRRSQWSMTRPANETTTSTYKSAMGLLLPNYRAWPVTRHSLLLPREEHDHDDCIAIELKPKAGYTATSPLVHPQRRIKYQQTRFKLLQDLYVRGLVQKAWTGSKTDADVTGIVQRSDYNPLDLFSHQHDRIANALQSLLACPQNNLRVWCCQRQVVGVDGSGIRCAPNYKFLAEYLRVDDDQVPAVLVDEIASILVKEPLLKQLLQLQRLDVIDGDGAILLHQRLVDLLGGSDSAAIALLDEYSARTTPANFDQHSPTLRTLLSHSPLEPPKDLVRVHAYCVLVDELQSMLGSFASNLDAAFLDESRRRALDMIQSFDVPDCQYLLQNWLLSLVMCDVSLFIRLRPNSDCLPSEDAIPTMNGLQYDLKIIDCDRKPASKLLSRLEKEVVINDLSV